MTCADVGSNERGRKKAVGDYSLKWPSKCVVLLQRIALLIALPTALIQRRCHWLTPNLESGKQALEAIRHEFMGDERWQRVTFATESNLIHCIKHLALALTAETYMSLQCRVCLDKGLCGIQKGNAICSNVTSQASSVYEGVRWSKAPYTDQSCALHHPRSILTKQICPVLGKHVSIELYPR